MFATAISYLSLGCSQTNTSFSDQISEATQDNQNKNNERYQSTDLQWLIYADPKADANLAIEKQNFTLLAFAGRVISFPGTENDSFTIQQQCGYRLLANSSDTLRSENELSLRKQLFQYAATYNQLVSAACRKHNIQKDN
jgi:hypothetical protein